MQRQDQSFRGRGRGASPRENPAGAPERPSRPFPPGDRRPTAREIVSRRLAEQAAAYPELVISPLVTPGLDDRDAALAHAIHDAVIRRWLTLGYLISQYTRQPVRELEPAMQGVLLAGAAQLLLFDRLPVHAVLNEMVELTKRLVRPGAAGMVNAVLRRIAEMVQGHEQRPEDWAQRRDALPLADGRILKLGGDVLPADLLERLAISTSHPHGLVRRWAGLHRREQLQALLLHTLTAPPTILNTSHATEPLPGQLVRHGMPGHHNFAGSRVDLLGLLESRSDLWVQDPASSRAVASIADLSPTLILDLCAGQGTKTRQLARTFPQARLIATDIDPQRHSTLATVFAQSGQVDVIAPEQIRASAQGQADLILLDVPCSNSGVLARRPEARYRADRAQLERLREIQREIVASAIPLLRSSPRGGVLYSTCSIDREENEFQVDWAMRELGLRIDRSDHILPAGSPGDDPRHYHDGAFYAFLT